LSVVFNGRGRPCSWADDIGNWWTPMTNGRWLWCRSLAGFRSLSVLEMRHLSIWEISQN